MWVSQTLGDLLPGLKGTAENLKSAADKVKAGFDEQLSFVQDKANTLNQIAGTTSQLLNDLAESGFYINMLPPSSGGYLDRINDASNEASAPPNDGYSAALVITLSAPDFAAVAAKYGKLVSALSSTSPAT